MFQSWQTGDRAVLGRRLLARLVVRTHDRAVAQFVAAESGAPVLLCRHGALARIVVQPHCGMLVRGTLPWAVGPAVWDAGENIFTHVGAPYSMLDILGVRGVCAALSRVAPTVGVTAVAHV